MDVMVREYKEEDYSRVSEILKNTFEYEKAKVSDSRVYEFVACLGEEIVGYFQLMEEIDIIQNFKIFHVGYVCVDSTYRGRGIGHTMMEYAISYAEEHGAKRMELTSGNQRLAAHKLYSSLGFVKRDSAIFRKELV